MFIIAKKIYPARILAGAAVLAIAIGVVGAGFGLAHEARNTETAAQVQVDPTGIRSNADRLAYLQKWGWMTAEEPASVEEVLIPETFDSSYDEYLALQESQGFQLKDYAGKTVKRYTYSITNYPGLQKDIWVSLLIYKKTVVGGEVFSNQGDGFTQGLAYPAGTSVQGA